ncbi:hypothetical protein [Azospirillum largimobile]
MRHIIATPPRAKPAIRNGMTVPTPEKRPLAHPRTAGATAPHRSRRTTNGAP